MKILLVIGLIIAGLSFGEGSFQNLAQSEKFHFDFTGWKSIGLSLMFVMFAYSGWNSATYIGSEIKNPRKIIPTSLLISNGYRYCFVFVVQPVFYLRSSTWENGK